MWLGAVDRSEAEEEAFLMWEVIHTLDPPTTNTELQEFFEACYVNVIADRSHFKVDRNVLGFITEKS